MGILPLDEAWREAIERVLRAHGWPGLGDASRLGPLVARLSDSYNRAGKASRELLPARLAFSFARDVPKGAGAVRELVATGLLALPEGRPLRVLDLGAGLGASTWGVARALEAAGLRGEVEARWVDTDDAALALGAELCAARGAAPVAVRAQTTAGGVAVPRGGEAYDLVLLGQVLSELDAGDPAETRVARHATLLRELLARSVRADGALVVIEPALKERTRHLHAVRDALLVAGGSVFAPCLHAAPCPALAHPENWCHEDLAVDLPEWLVPLARAAGLRWQGLTFSYLVLRKDGATLAARAFPWRVVSSPIVTKGKRELFLCGEGVRLRAQRLDRHESEANRAWTELARGARIALRPPPAPAGPPAGPFAGPAPLVKVLAATDVDVDVVDV